MAIKTAIILFIILEMSNVLTLYIAPSSKLGNGLGVFLAYKLADKDKNIRPIIRYMGNWIANVKVIMNALLLVIVLYGSATLQLYTAIALMASIVLYYITLLPIIISETKNNKILPKRYGLYTTVIISVMILTFAAAIIITYI